MAGQILTDNTALAADFINSSEKDAVPANDEGRVVKLESTGRLHSDFLPLGYGGDGSDGALSVSSGNTNIDLGGAKEVFFNYSSISITGTGSVTFINPHSEGSLISLKCLGDFTITSSTVPALSAVGCGAQGGAKATVLGTDGNIGNAAKSIYFDINPGNAGSVSSGASISGGVAPTAISYNKTLSSYVISHKMPLFAPGAGAGSGAWKSGANGTPGDGGDGGGVLIIEVAGTVNFTTVGGISVSGSNGQNATVSSGTASVGGGGGGGGGCVFFKYKFATAMTGTITSVGGTKGSSINTDGSGASFAGSGAASVVNNGGSSTSTAGDGGDGISITEIV